jgi:poly(3-hydroxybutyrate) depolymerase
MRAILYLLLLLAPTAYAYDTLDLEIDGVKRSARVFAGEKAETEPSPLLIVFHGRGDNERDFSRAVGLHDDWPEATVVYPRGEVRKDEAGMRGWLGAHDRDDVNHDLVFVDRMLEELPKRYRVDPRKVYVGGFSNGGRFTFILLARRPDAFAAFVPVGALDASVSGATQPRPVMYLFGRGEPREYERTWAETVVAIARLNKADGRKRDWAPGFTEYMAGEGGATTIVSLYDAGHIWPYSGNEQIIRFLKEHALEQVPP